MNILAVDTATQSCSVAVAADGVGLAETTFVSKQTHSKHVMGMIEALLGLSGFDLTDMNAFAVTSGPGSFTGLRIGIAMVKGFAAALDKPLIGISSLEILAHQAGPFEGVICPMLDARQKEVYYSAYRQKEGQLIGVMEAKVGPPREALTAVQPPALFIGDGARLYWPNIKEQHGELVKLAPESQSTIRAAVLARLATDRFKHNRIDAVETFAPLYLRKSHAELKLGPPATRSPAN